MKVKTAPDIAKRTLKVNDDYKIDISLSQANNGDYFIVVLAEDLEDVAAVGLTLEQADQLVVNLQQILIKARVHLMARQT